jgi:hypothetical protein
MYHTTTTTYPQPHITTTTITKVSSMVHQEAVIWWVGVLLPLLLLYQPSAALGTVTMTTGLTYQRTTMATVFNTNNIYKTQGPGKRSTTQTTVHPTPPQGLFQTMVCSTPIWTVQPVRDIIREPVMAHTIATLQQLLPQPANLAKLPAYSQPIPTTVISIVTA